MSELSRFNRRQFLYASSALALTGLRGPNVAAQSAAHKLVVMVYLKGGNDGYNTLFQSAMHATSSCVQPLPKDATKC
ncbi:hypothetical protein AEM42_10020 [Betaproteobacteria bacterium UKL13-2]|nr:hypothetical protein AEM42_10020 [Betaproteobacteria bacterium UKL13-2]